MFTYEQIQSLNELELSVYEYVIKNVENIGNMKIRDLADSAHVSTTTVLRFCTKMGCKGYSEFKVKLKLDIEKRKATIQLDDTDQMRTFFAKFNTPEFSHQIEACSDLIAKSKNVLFYGIGTSGILGQYGARYFSNIGIYSSYVTDPFFPVPSSIEKNSLLIVLSVSGETEILLNQVNWYKEKHFKVISITNSSQSTLAKMSDVSIGYYMPIEIQGHYYNVTTQVPVVHIIETIGRKTVQKRKVTVND